jgi:hypothetical protein
MTVMIKDGGIRPLPENFMVGPSVHTMIRYGAQQGGWERRGRQRRVGLLREDAGELLGLQQAEQQEREPGANCRCGSAAWMRIVELAEVREDCSEGRGVSHGEPQRVDSRLEAECHADKNGREQRRKPRMVCWCFNFI